jgi:hypothetical protein
MIFPASLMAEPKQGTYVSSDDTSVGSEEAAPWWSIFAAYPAAKVYDGHVLKDFLHG